MLHQKQQIIIFMCLHYCDILDRFTKCYIIINNMFSSFSREQILFHLIPLSNFVHLGPYEATFQVVLIFKGLVFFSTHFSSELRFESLSFCHHVPASVQVSREYCSKDDVEHTTRIRYKNLKIYEGDMKVDNSMLITCQLILIYYILNITKRIFALGFS